MHVQSILTQNLCSYVKLDEKMKLLWDAEMRVNTVIWTETGHAMLLSEGLLVLASIPGSCV